MYPRLRLSRNLLKDSGVIFVSIDENEIHNLKQILNETFGEENFVGCLKWKKKKQPSYLHGHIAKVMEYLLVYAKNSSSLEKLSIEKRTDNNTRIDNASNNVSEKIIKKGILVKLPEDTELIKAGVYKNKTMQTEFLDDVIIKNGRTQNDVRVKAQFRNEQTALDNFVKEDVIYITRNFGFRRDLLKEELEKRKSITDLLLDWGDNQDSDKEMNELFPEGKPFDYPKPSKLISNLISSINSEDEIILDFFAGSGTTADAVLRLNALDNGNRKFILVQLDEIIKETETAYKLGYRKISDVTKERISRVSKAINKTNSEITKEEKQLIDCRFFKLNHSNYKPWKNYTGTDIKELEMQFENNSSPLIDNWNKENLIFEVLLIEGFPMDSKLENLENYKFNIITEVVSEYCSHKLLICLDNKIDDNTIKSLKLSDNDIFICLDNAISDKDKVTLQDKGLIKTI